MNACGMSGGIAPFILTFDTRWGEWLVLCPSWFTLRTRAFGSHQIGDWVGRVAGLDASGEEKKSCPYQESNYDT
jgi:hypothetical protein